MIPSPLRIGLHPSIAPSLSEVTYVLRTLTRLAGVPCHFMWAAAAQTDELDLYYGPDAGNATARICIRSSGRPFSLAPTFEPAALHQNGGLPVLDFGDQCRAAALDTTPARFDSDIVFGTFWLLTGARDTSYPRDRWDNLHIEKSFIARSGLLTQPLVSLYAAWLRELLQREGRQPLPLPWLQNGSVAAFALTHDVDYPEIIRWIETVRLGLQRGLRAWPSVRGVWSGDNHFWQFPNWLAFETAVGARSAFYFMARRGSLLQYALGTPDAFYDIRTPRFRALFRELNDAGCEIGLHASFHAHASVDALKHEREVLEDCAATSVIGVRHHYWHLDPRSPHETLRRHEEAGLAYDSTLGFELFPGFRRGICHPFHPFDANQRRELTLLELPTSWMDDHFDRRTRYNDIADPDAYARNLLSAVRASAGIAVVDYHARGMNSDFYPRYGRWLSEFIARDVDASFTYYTPKEISGAYTTYEIALDSHSRDETQTEPIVVRPEAYPVLDLHPMRTDEIAEVAAMHLALFGGASHGTSMANLGLEFLSHVFYRLNVDNPSLHIDVARYGGDVVGFSAYSSGGSRIFGRTMRRHPMSIAGALLRAAFRHPVAVAKHILDNVRFVFDHSPAPLNDVPGWWIVAGVHPDLRSSDFKKRTGISVSDELMSRMKLTLRAKGCDSFWGVTPETNAAMNRFLQKQGGIEVARDVVQGIPCVYYHVPLVA